MALTYDFIVPEENREEYVFVTNRREYPCRSSHGYNAWLETDVHTDIDVWLRENQISYDFSSAIGDEDVEESPSIFHFKSEEDLVLFKLKWC